jgi:tetratricopeptide (TPR) repeat protein
MHMTSRAGLRARFTGLHRPLRALARAAALCLATAAVPAAALAQPAASGAGDAPITVAAPHYGDTLFRFYQGRYFTAITTLMASQQFQRIAPHDDEAEVLRGGMLLSYGLHEQAGRIFEQLIEGRTSASVRDRAWFFLAKIRFQRGLPDEAESALAKVGSHLPPSLQEEHQLLLAQIYMGRQDYARASELLEPLHARPGSSPYVRFNLGVSQVRAGDLERGSATLDVLGRSTQATEELRSLRDKANLALGFAALQAEQPEIARRYLERVRLKSAQSTKALLGFGWAAAAMKQPELALVPWMELLQREPGDSAVLEARIAVPYAYAEARNYSAALDGYNEAIQLYEREHAKLDETIAAVNSGKLIDALAARNPGEEMGWLWSLQDLPDLPHPTHFSAMLAQHEFQEAFKNWRDLQFLDGNLQQWADSLSVFGDMLANRRQAYAERLPKVLEASKHTGAQALTQRAEGLATELKQAEQDGDGLALATEAQREQLRRLQAMQAALQRVQSAGEADPDLATLPDRLRLLQGALTWDLARQYPGQLWQASKGMAAVQDGLAESRDREARIAAAQKDEPARFEAFARRIDELAARIKALQPRVVALRAEQQQAAQAIAVRELVSQKDRLAVYATQARFAVAQLVDRANQTQKGADAPVQAPDPQKGAGDASAR